MAHLIVYSSLMHEDELFEQGLSGHNIELIKVHNYKRVFNIQKSSANEDKIASLNIEASYGDFFNAILIKDLDEAYFEAYDFKEKDFLRKSLEVVTYDHRVYPNAFIYEGKKKYINTSLSSNDEEKEFCKTAALSYGEEFYEDFLQSTYEYTNENLSLIK